MKRALAHIEKIEWIKPIEGADNIELIGVLGWVCIAQIGEFQVGDTAVYIEIDSLCPQFDERFAFLARKNFKVKTMKLSKLNVISQGLALPISLFPELSEKKIGDDVTKELKIKHTDRQDSESNRRRISPDAKYKAMENRRKRLFSNLFIKEIMKYSYGKKVLFFLFGSKYDIPREYPEWISKTDEERIENIPWILQNTEKWVKTEKCDGTSCTYAVERIKRHKDKFQFIVCSRNVRINDREQACYHQSNIYWELADKYEIEKVLTEFAVKNKLNRVVLQGEGVGNVQNNPYKLSENRLYVFNLIVEGRRYGTLEMAAFCKKHHLMSVPIIDDAYELPKTMEEIKADADGFSQINPKVRREAFVYRTLDGTKSFKNVSRLYLLKHDV